ncbi:hypothetical protein GWI33_020160 [Rhynchophorus ferrugineus]|uniref:Uncharacterized protein n=1 Tax=Rhynchophorus ferrugineus TaxID=354439 RepID=A0A834M4H5_RHYFE|nr:hypothetical protein GWI33_020160 [Rhynchophorus ferrugineus]
MIFRAGSRSGMAGNFLQVYGVSGGVPIYCSPTYTRKHTHGAEEKKAPRDKRDGSGGSVRSNSAGAG